MLVGWGDQAIARIEQEAPARGLELWRDGPMIVANPPGTLVAQAGGSRSWLLGRSVDGRPDPAAVLLRAVLARDGDHPRGSYVGVVAGPALTVVNDHLASRSLVYAATEGGGLVAEHVADLLGLLPSSPGPDRGSVAQWCDRRTLALGRTMYAGVGRLSPGRLIELDAAGPRERTWWEPRYRAPQRAPRAELIERLRSDTLAAVARTAGDVALPAVKLSGGLDSATVAAGVRHMTDGRVLAFASVFPEHDAVDESALIEASVAASRLELHRVTFDAPSLLMPALEYLARWRVPPATPNIFVWRELMARVRGAGADVLLDGEGGDEVFGLQPFLMGDRVRAGRLLSAWRLSGRLPAVQSSRDLRRRTTALKAHGLRGGLPVSVQDWRRRRRPVSDFSGPLVRVEDRALVAERDDPWAFKRRDGPLWWSAMMQEWLVSGELLDVSGHLQRDAIDGGVDQRHPFLHDVGLMEAIAHLPPDAAYARGRDRALLRDAMRGLVSDAVLQRREKSYFTDLSLGHMEGPEGAWLAARLREPGAPIRGYVDGPTLDRLLDVSRDDHWRRAVRSISVFSIGMTDCWLRSLDDPDWVSGAISALSDLNFS